MAFAVLTLLLTGCGSGSGGGGGVSSGSSSNTGSASLYWVEPVSNTDGSFLTDLSGYKLYYGTSSGNYSTELDVGNVTSGVITGLTSGTTYYIAVTVYDKSGNESGYSNEIVRLIV